MANLNFEEKLQNDFQEYKKNTKKPNILIIGGTGVGKSTLINKCFGNSIAKAGTGEPVTQEIEKYEGDNTPVVLFDTKGYEIGGGKEDDFLRNIKIYLSDEKESKNQIHLAWYCIQSSGHRVTDFDIKSIKLLRESGIPVAVLLNKAELISDTDSQALRNSITISIDDIIVFETSGNTDSFDSQLANLCTWSYKTLPETLRRAFVAAQRQNLSLKREEANDIINQHLKAAAAIPFTPIPLADGPMLLANQTGMIARIVYIYNLEGLFKSPDAKLLSILIGPIIIRSGVMVAGSLLKLIPVIGTIAGGFINAIVATGITYAIGYATITMCETIVEKHLDEKDYFTLESVVETASKIFKTAFESALIKKL